MGYLGAVTRQLDDPIKVDGEHGNIQRRTPLQAVVRRCGLPSTPKTSTGVNRGYLAKWRVGDDRLELVEILDPHRDSWPEAMARAFPDAPPPHPLSTRDVRDE